MVIWKCRYLISTNFFQTYQILIKREKLNSKTKKIMLDTTKKKNVPKLKKSSHGTKGQFTMRKNIVVNDANMRENETLVH